MRLKISTWGLYYLKSKDLYALGLADSETNGQKKTKSNWSKLEKPMVPAKVSRKSAAAKA